MYRKSCTLIKNKIYSASGSMDERSRYSRTSESEKQIRYEVHSKRTISTQDAYWKVRHEIKQKINTTKIPFYKNILHTKNKKDIQKVIYHILKPKSPTLEGNEHDINNSFNSTAARVADKKPLKTPDIYRTITSLSENNTTEQFELQTNSDEGLKIIKSLRNDCSTGYDYIPIFLIIPVAEYILSLLAYLTIKH